MLKSWLVAGALGLMGGMPNAQAMPIGDVADRLNQKSKGWVGRRAQPVLPRVKLAANGLLICPTGKIT
jgi:hypothetical protein